AAIEAVDANRYEPMIRPSTFSLSAFNRDMAGTNAKLMEALNGR
ncbi:MAG: allophanate hydrolase, partial [Rhodobacter sp.]|nr:allophanate hydrolase [Rhodobacter sp.]